MAKKQKDILLDHDYDGIKELDNDLPPWWLYMFYLSIAFGLVYLVYFHVLGLGDSSAVEYEKEMNPNYVAAQAPSKSLISTYHSPYYNPKGDVSPQMRALFDEYIGPKVGFAALMVEALKRYQNGDIEKLKEEFERSVGNAVDFNTLVKEAMVRGNASEQARLKKVFPELWAEVAAGGVPQAQPAMAAKAPAVKSAEIKTYKALMDEANLQKGKEIFVKNCVSCHGPQGQGGIGPNLTDDYWLHGAGINNVAHTITVGVPAKGMITWRGILKEKEIEQVASYILTLHGTNPPKPKAPQGEKVEYPLTEAK